MARKNGKRGRKASRQSNNTHGKKPDQALNPDQQRAVRRIARQEASHQVAQEVRRNPVLYANLCRALGAFVAVLAAAIGFAPNVSAQVVPGPGSCPTMGGVTPIPAWNSACVYRLAQAIKFNVPEGWEMDVFDIPRQAIFNSQWPNSGNAPFVATDFTLKPTNFSIPSTGDPNLSTPAPGGQPRSSTPAASTPTYVAQQPEPQHGHTAMAPANDEWLRCPNAGDREHAAYLLFGDAKMWQHVMQPEPGNFPDTWVFQTSGQPLQVNTRDLFDVEFNAGNGVQVMNQGMTPLIESGSAKCHR